MFFYYTSHDAFLKFWQYAKGKKSSSMCSHTYAILHCGLLEPSELSRAHLGGILSRISALLLLLFFIIQKKKKKACLPAIVLVCSACYAEWNKPPLDWMRIRALWIRLIKRDFLLEPKWLTTLCLWELSGHVYFQVKCKLKLSCQKSSKISEPVTKPRGFNHCPSGISTGSFCIATASTFLTFLPRCSPTPALNCLGAQLLFNLWSISGQ